MSPNHGPAPNPLFKIINCSENKGSEASTGSSDFQHKHNNAMDKLEIKLFVCSMKTL